MSGVEAAVLTRPLASLKGVGTRRAAALAHAGLVTLEDLLLRFPTRYEDRRRPTPLAELQPGTTAAALATITSTALRRTRRPGFTIFEATLRDRSGQARAVWFNQRFLRDVFHPGQLVALYGKVEQTGAGLQLTSPDYEIVADADTLDIGEGPTDYGRIVPIYERVGTLTPRIQRALVAQAVAALPDVLDDPLPEPVRTRLGLPGRAAALRETHFPSDDANVDELNAFRSPAQRRLILEEFFLFQLGVLLRRRDRLAERKPHVIRVDDRIRASARAVLAFALTPGQKEALRTIVEDLQKPEPMNRLLQGDVGSGKTIVALLAALVVLENDLQVAFMAPTEILAEQQAQTMQRLLAPTRFRVGCLTGRIGERERRPLRAELASGALPFIVGTHALVEEEVRFARLGLAIIDEQHRFGVIQRSRLREKGVLPDVLVMTATPIPRTLALTAYGELDVSVIRDRPQGRRPVRTTVRPESRRQEVWQFVRGELEAGRQAYVIYPLVEESDKLDLRDATAMADDLAQNVFPEWKVGLLHGRLPADAKARVMAAFAAGELHVLVSTTVVEVGVDVPNATVMVVEHAERFGLSQLHQLRGRVGRGPHQAHCVLLYQPPLLDDAQERLKAIAETTDGFALAERDLQLRGPGDFFGTRQSGMPTLRIGSLVRDYALLEQAREEAARWLEEAPPGDPTIQAMREGWAERFGLVDVG
ncbi:MAG TPA: ATP-dependent DNA helicase RecG [Vicinamibacterales bacterium]